jgi:hypothetical protein
MARRTWWAAGVVAMLAGSSGCGLLCDRYCERERDRCDRFYNRGCCAPAPAACPPGCAPAPTPGYYTPSACP